jgi:hypothetical protein
MLDLLFGIKNTTTRSVKNVLSRVTRIIHIVLFSLIGLFILHSLYQMQHLSDMTLLLFTNLPIPFKVYPNADTDKLNILFSAAGWGPGNPGGGANLLRRQKTPHSFLVAVALVLGSPCGVPQLVCRNESQAIINKNLTLIT